MSSHLRLGVFAPSLAISAAPRPGIVPAGMGGRKRPPVKQRGKMKGLLLAGLLGAALGVAVVQPGGIAGFLDDPSSVLGTFGGIFPMDRARQEALDACFEQDHGFNRLLSAEREACYERVLPARQAQGSGNALVAQAANFVDLWKAAGQGAAPKNDIRSQQQAARVVHPANAR